MWRTSIGERTLRGKEWELFREGLSSLRLMVELSLDGADVRITEVGAFDALQPASRLAMLALVAKALHDPAEPCPALTALTEGTFAAVYAGIRQHIEIEIEIDWEKVGEQPLRDRPLLRDLVLAAFHEACPEWPDPLPGRDCDDLDEWSFLLDALMDRVLWDRDFDEEGLFLDAEPELAAHLKKELGVAEGYFTAIAPDPTGEPLATIRETLRRLCEPPQQRDQPEPGEDAANPWF